MLGDERSALPLVHAHYPAVVRAGLGSARRLKCVTVCWAAHTQAARDGASRCNTYTYRCIHMFYIYKQPVAFGG